MTVTSLGRPGKRSGSIGGAVGDLGELDRQCADLAGRDQQVEN
jgi:hypothetical protein